MTLKLTLYVLAGLAVASSAVAEPPKEANPAASAETPSAASAQTPASADAAQPGGIAAVSAADSSKLASTDAFVVPTLKAPDRAAYGSAAGKADDFPAVRELQPHSQLMTVLFGSGAVLSLLLTGGLAFAVSRSTKADGSPTRAFTLGTKLSLGFGTVITGMLAMSALNSKAASVIANATAASEHLTEQDLLIAAMEADVVRSRLHIKGFLLANSDEELTKYSNAAASFAHKYKLAEGSIRSPERVELLKSIGDQMRDYEAKFAEVVALIDSRNAIIDSQMGPAAVRATELLAEISSTASADGDAQAALDATDTSAKLQEARIEFFKFLRSGSEASGSAAGRYAEETIQSLAKLEAEVKNPRRKVWLREGADAMRFWIARMQESQKLQRDRNELVLNGLDKIGPKITQDSLALIDSLNASRTEMITKAERIAAASEAQSATIAGLMALVGAAVALGIARSVIRPISTMISTISEIRSSNDLTRRVDAASRDEIGRLGEAFNGMIQTLHDIIAEVKSGAVQIDAGGTQIASASQTMAQGASEQASSLQQISASLEEISGQTQQAAENARQANALASESKKSADRGQQEMSQMNEAVNAIKQSSGEISKIIKVIDEIAFQTNLLALNAAVEAARAGEAGKGFAVVAEEVRNLAQRSAEAAKSTSSMIEESVKRSENGVQIASRVGQALEEITTSTNKVNALLAEIASAASEQATGVGQINQGVGQLDQVTQQNAGNSEELASSAEELSSQVASLNELVEQFKVTGQNSRSGAAKPAAYAAHARGAVKNPKPAAKPKPITAGKTVDKTTQAAEKAIPMGEEESLASF